MQSKSKVIILAGVSGTGKSFIGKKLAEKLGIPFYDADDYHSVVNRDKMAGGAPLTDEDRMDWLKTLSDQIRNWCAAKGGVLACSALKAKYRIQLIGENKACVEVVILTSSFEVLKKRVQDRKNHFMPDSLLQSQFDTLEILSNDKQIEVNRDWSAIVEDIQAIIR